MGKPTIPSIVAYVLPFALYLGLTQVPYSDYPWLYAVVVAVVGAVTLGLLRGRQLLRPHRHVAAGIAVGLVGIALWIPLSLAEWEKPLIALLPSALQPGPRTGFDPFTKIASPVGQWAFVAVRLVGLAVLVPVVEELFWRGFLARWLIDADWEKQELGKFTPFSFAVVTLLFALAHPEWLAAAVYGVLLNGLLWWKRDLWHCVVAHGVSNLVLGVYVVAAQAWQLW